MTKVALISLIVVLVCSPFACAQGVVNSLVGTLNTTVEPTKSQPAAPPSEDFGTNASEVLPGNGTRAGYMLSHGSVIAGSEWVDIGTHHGARNRDYAIDYASGAIFFTEPVSQSSSVRVDYRYSKNAATERTAAAPGLVSLRFGGNIQSNMLYAYRAADSALGFGGQDILTYGMNTITKLGGASSLSSMFYVASPQNSNRLAVDTMGQPGKGKPAKVKKDRLMVQDADLSAGKVRLKLGYQDVGQDFAGFASMRDSKAAAKDVLDQLEKEKGIKRMSITGEMPSGTDQGLTFAVSQVSDKNDDIVSRSFGYRSDSFRVALSSREVGKAFSRFKDIREADRGQLAAEAGLKRQNIGMQFRTGLTGDKKPVWSGINITQLSGGGGSLSYETAEVDLGKIKVQADIRSMDLSFNKLGALTDEERARMALMARRQFDPAAPATQVTAADKAAITNEQGLDRTTCVVTVDGSAVDTWLSLSSVDSSQGGVSRKAIGMDSGPFSAHLSTQTIGGGFQKLAVLQPVERVHFGNEFGMTRTEMGGRLKIAGSDVTIDSASVIDNKGAGVFRETVTLKNSRIAVRANIQDIDPRFSRIMDLSDPDKKNLQQDLGFKRSDYAMTFQATKSLLIDSYFYDSTNVTEGQTRGQTRHKIVYTPLRGPKVNLLRDSYSYISESGNLASYSHQEIKFDHTFNFLGGLAFKGRNDVYTDQEALKDPQNTTISENHVESNPKAKTSFTADVVNIDYGMGRTEDTQSVAVKSAAVRTLSFIAGFSTTERDSGKSEQNGKLGFEWAATKDLKMTFSMANRDGDTQGSQQNSSFSLNGPLAKRFLFLRDVVIASGSNQTALRGKQTICDNAFKIDAGLAGGKLTFDNTDKLNPKNGIYYTSRIFQYESNKDPKRPMHLTIFKQNLTTPLGVRANKRNYSLDLKAAGNTTLTVSSYLGKDGPKGTVNAVGGTVIKISRPIGSTTFIADYTADSNAATARRARVVGFGISRTISPRSSYELYYGWCSLAENGSSDGKNVFRAKYDAKIDAGRYVSFTLQRKSGVEKGSINLWEGDTVGRLDLNFAFN